MTSNENIATLRATIEVLEDHIASLKEFNKIAKDLKDDYCNLYKQEKANNLVLKAMLFCLIAQRGNEQ